METWSAGKAVLHGIGLEITRDFLFFDLLDVLFKENDKKNVIIARKKDIFYSSISNTDRQIIRYVCHLLDKSILLETVITDEETCTNSTSPVQTLDDEGFPRVLSLQFLHHIVQFMVQLQHKVQRKHTTQVPYRNYHLKMQL